jgi:hypothetical protein
MKRATGPVPDAEVEGHGFTFAMNGSTSQAKYPMRLLANFSAVLFGATEFRGNK